MRKALGLMVLALTMVVGVAPRANAGLILAGTAGGVNFCATDNNAVCAFGIQLLDQSATPGVLTLLPALIGGLDIQGSLHTQQFGPPENILNSSSLSIVNTTDAPVAFQTTVGATDFVGPIDSATTTGSGTWVNSTGSNITMTWWNDALNRQSGETALDREGLLVDLFNDIAGTGIDSFSHNGGPFPVSDPALFSMALGFDGTLNAGASLISRGQSEVKEVVPEPASLAMLGIGLAAFAFQMRRRQRQ